MSIGSRGNITGVSPNRTPQLGGQIYVADMAENEELRNKQDELMAI